MEAKLLEQFDTLVEARGASRSEALRDLMRAEVVKSHIQRGVDSVASLTVVYNRTFFEVGEHIAAMQDELGDQLRSTMHISLGHDFCLDVLVLRGPHTRSRRTPIVCWPRAASNTAASR